MNLWMAYTCNEVGLEDVEKMGNGGCTSYSWPRSSDIWDFVIDHSSKLKRIESMVKSQLTSYNTENGAPFIINFW